MPDRFTRDRQPVAESAAEGPEERIEPDIDAIVEAEDPATVGDPAPPVAEAPVDPASDQPPEGAGPGIVAATSDDRFTLGNWGGIVQHNCAAPRCKFDTLNGFADFEEHWNAVHVLPKPKPKPSTLVDANGNPLT